MRRLLPLAALIVVAYATPAAAQTYASGGIGAAISRSYSSSGSFTFDGNNSEVVSWMLRAGTSVSSLFGVELEFVRDAKVDVEANVVNPAATGVTATAPPAINAVTGTVVRSSSGQISIFPTPQVDTDFRTTTWNATAFVRKSIASRSELVFLGGIGISRVVQHSKVSYDPRILAIRIDLETETTAYGVGPIVGAEARIGMTDHLQLTPGFRVQSLGNDLTDGIVLRPSVTLGWTF